MNRAIPLSLLLLLAPACDTETPTSAVVDNDSTNTVYKAWWSTSLFATPIAASKESESERAIPATDFVYALLAPGWDPASGPAPTRLVVVRSKDPLSVVRGDELHIHVSDATFVGNCETGPLLSQDDADFITQRIFPGDFVGVAYDAATCTTVPTR
jgi:hypothetical protein